MCIRDRSYGSSLVHNKLFFTVVFKIFKILVIMYLGMDLFLNSLCFLDLMSASFPRLGKFSAIISSDKFSAPFSLFSFFDFCNVNVIPLDVVP